MPKPIFIIQAPAGLSDLGMHMLREDSHRVMGGDYTVAIVRKVENTEWTFQCFNPDEMPKQKHDEIMKLINKIDNESKVRETAP